MLYSLESRQSGLGLADAFFTAFSAGTCTGLATFNITAFGGAAKALLASVVACSSPSPHLLRSFSANCCRRCSPR